MNAINSQKQKLRNGSRTGNHGAACLFFLGALLLVTLPACSKKTVVDAKAVPEVTVVAPLAKDIQPYEDFPGRAMPIETVAIKARVTGVLSEIKFREGSEVKQGDLLYLIDPREYKAEYDSQAATFAQTQARVAQTLADSDRAKRLSSETAISKQEQEKQYTAYREAEAVSRSAQAAMEKARLNLEYTQIRAPISGKISRTNVTQGNLLTDGDTLTTIVQQNPIYVYFEVPERLVLNWQEATRNIPNATVASTTKVFVGLANETDYPRESTLDFTDNSIDSGTGTLSMRAIIPNEDRRVQPGMFARVRMMLNNPVPALLVPDRAIGIDQGQRFVFVVGADNKVEYRHVTVGQVYDGLRSILSGVKPDEHVVIEGIQNIQSGTVVNPVVEDLAKNVAQSSEKNKTAPATP